jgi:hypothetical protein
VLNGADMVPLVISSFDELEPAAEGYLQNLATVACSIGVVDRSVCLRISHQYLICALVRSRGIVFLHYYRSLPNSAGKDFRDGAIVPFESLGSLWLCSRFTIRRFAFQILTLNLLSVWITFSRS